MRKRNDNGYSIWQHEGVVMRGIYVDQLKNFLCAGWKPEQIFITFTFKLHAEPLKLLKEIASFVGIPFNIDIHLEKQLNAGEQVQRASRTHLHDPITSEVKDSFTELNREYNEALIHFLNQHNFVCNISLI